MTVLEKTRIVYLLVRFLNIPFWVIFNLLSVILYKDLHATSLQIMAVIAIKPAVSLLSPYWSQMIHRRPDRLISNLVWANILRFLPFLFFPFLSNVWLFILAFGCYMAFHRGVIPAWMEVIKLNLPGKERERVFGLGSVMEYVGTIILPVAFGWILDDFPDSWRWIFCATAGLGVLSTIVLYWIPLNTTPPADTEPSISLSQQLINPFKQSWDLLRQRPDFARFQLGFMLGGSGLMVIQTILPMFFVDFLQLSYTEITIAVAVCKGIGFAVTSPFWVKYFNRINIYSLSGAVTLLAALFPLFLLAAYYNILMVYAAYLVYGMMQAGSELSWHLSGPHFAQHEDSTVYSSTNVIMVGVRGCIAPLFGHMVYTMTNSPVVLLVGFALCLIATERLKVYGQQERLKAEN